MIHSTQLILINLAYYCTIHFNGNRVNIDISHNKTSSAFFLTKFIISTNDVEKVGKRRLHMVGLLSNTGKVLK